MMNERPGSTASRRASSSRMASVLTARLLFAVFARPGRIDTAQRAEVTKPASLRGQLRVHRCAPRGMILRERFQPGPPMLRDHVPAESFLTVFRQRILLGRDDALQFDPVVAHADETSPGDAGFREYDAGGPSRMQHGVERELRRIHARTPP